MQNIATIPAPANALATGPSLEELALIARAFSPRRDASDLRALLGYLNGLTNHRFTGVYRFEPGWVVSVALWDRADTRLELGADVKMKESYCWLTGISETSYIIEDALADCRLDGHAAQSAVRSYVAVLLHDKYGTPWGTLCHFDFAPRGLAPDALARLELFRPLVEEMLVRDAEAQWNPDAPSSSRSES